MNTVHCTGTVIGGVMRILNTDHSVSENRVKSLQLQQAAIEQAVTLYCNVHLYTVNLLYKSVSTSTITEGPDLVTVVACECNGNLT